MSLAATLGKYTGIILADALWYSEIGLKAATGYYVSKISIESVKNVSMEKVSEIAKQHAIDSHNPEKVTENIFNCLEFID